MEGFISQRLTNTKVLQINSTSITYWLLSSEGERLRVWDVALGAQIADVMAPADFPYACFDFVLEFGLAVFDMGCETLRFIF